jgi:hypothetical protein
MSIGLASRLGILALAALFAGSPLHADGRPVVVAQTPQAQPPPAEEPEEGGDQQQFLEALRELLAPALDGVRSFAPDGDNPDVVKIETDDPALPVFFANLIEEETTYSPEQTMEQIRSGFASCQNEQADARRTNDQVTMASFSIVCRTEEGGELQMFVITLNDSDRTQALMLGTPVQNGAALIDRGRRVFQGLTGGTP